MSSESPSEPSITSLGPCSTAFDVLKATKADLSGKTAIVTGGASGIGAVTSEALAKAGAKVIIACRRVAEGEKVAAEIKSKGYKVRERGEGRRRERGSDAVRSVDPHRSLLASTSSWRHHETSRSFPRSLPRSAPPPLSPPPLSLSLAPPLFPSPFPQGSASVRQLDLADLSSVRSFAAQVSAEEARVDVLVNNAGVMACPPMRTKDGLELQIGTCHHGHFALTRALLPKLKETPQPPARVVTVASLAHRSGGLDPEDLHWRERPYGRVTAYGAAKLANVLFARELARREGGGGGGGADGGDSKLLSFSLHPGVIHTPLFRHVIGEGRLASVLNPAMDWVGWGVRGVLTRALGFPGVKTVEQGAATSVFAAVAPLSFIGKSIPNGSYLSDCRLGETTPEGKDDALAARLWEVTEKEVDAVLAKKSSKK